MEKFSTEYWEAIKADYCSGARSVREIADYYKVGTDTVYRHRAKDGWQRQGCNPPAPAQTWPGREGWSVAGAWAHLMLHTQLTARMLNLCERTVAEIEMALAQPPNETKPGNRRTTMDRARDVRTLTTVSRLIDKLKEAPAVENAPDPMGETEQDEHLLRQEIAERLGRLQDAGSPN